MYGSSGNGGLVLKALGLWSKGSNPGPTTSISDIGYLQLPSPDMIEIHVPILLKWCKIFKETKPTNHAHAMNSIEASKNLRVIFVPRFREARGH